MCKNTRLPLRRELDRLLLQSSHRSMPSDSNFTARQAEPAPVACGVLLRVESKAEEAELVRKLIINGLVIAVLAGCSCGKWVDVGSFAVGAGCKELEDMKKPANKEAMML